MDEQQQESSGRSIQRLTDEEIIAVYRKCFPRGLPVRDDDMLYFALAILDQQ